ncbi:MAG TPA: hypothetical protein VHX65_20570 [Pirellulales bacterium]|jgi:hypothetical protein|nr:hypothetical protein [Pirellulales bacterium]
MIPATNDATSQQSAIVHACDIPVFEPPRGICGSAVLGVPGMRGILVETQDADFLTNSGLAKHKAPWPYFIDAKRLAVTIARSEKRRSLIQKVAELAGFLKSQLLLAAELVDTGFFRGSAPQ